MRELRIPSDAVKEIVRVLRNEEPEETKADVIGPTVAQAKEKASHGQTYASPKSKVYTKGAEGEDSEEEQEDKAENEELFRSNELNGKTIGIIGFGRIGKMMARFSNAMGMNVVIFDPFVISNDTKVTQLDSKEELLINSDIVSLHYHLTSETENSFNAYDFAIMKKGAFFLNTARAELVDEEAMLESLSNGHLKGAAVDVITYEYMYDKWNHPVVKFSREHDNLVLSPHVAGLTIESERKSANDIIDQLIDYFENK